MSNMEVDYPIQDFELNHDTNKNLHDVIAKNFNTIINVIQSHDLYDVIHLKHLRELCNVLHIMINEYADDVNLYAGNSMILGNFRDAGLNMDDIINRKKKIFPTLSPWQLREMLQQLETVLWFVTELKLGLMNDFRINNLFSVCKINTVGDLINGVHSFLNDHFKFGYNIKADFSILIKNGDLVDSVIKKFKKKKYLDEDNRIKISNILQKCLVYEISFNFVNLGIIMNPLKNF
ncbi:putative p27 protein [Pueraria lobata-associated crinivirus]|nr:putative p27 protein [Pueraria lobata-associated crinivirus]